MSLRDEHLMKALQHAPDSDIAPSDAARKEVLDYADKAVKLRRESWFTGLINAFNHWQIPRWQVQRWQTLGMGSLAASLLVVVMIWHENPDDPIQVASAPDAVQRAVAQSEAAPQSESRPEPKLTQTELARDDLNKAAQSQRTAAATTPATETMSAPEVASAEIAAPNVQDKVVAKAKSAKLPAETEPQVAAVEQAASAEAPAEKLIVASVPEAAAKQVAAKDADSTRAKTRAATNEAAALPAPVAAAPAPVAASAEASTGAASEQVADKAVKKMAAAEAPAKHDMPSSNNALAQAISKQGGKLVANKDIQAGRLRILDLSKNAATVDEETGYRIQFIADDSATLASEVAAYNQTMREWHLKQK